MSNVNRLRDRLEQAFGYERLSVISCDGESEKDRTLRSLLTAEGVGGAGEPAIVYCSTIKDAERLSQQFSDLPFPVLCYHGRQNNAVRLASQNVFMDGPPAVMFATNAFGLGIDKADIRQVIHYNLPGSIEAY